MIQAEADTYPVTAGPYTHKSSQLESTCFRFPVKTVQLCLLLLKNSPDILKPPLTS